MSKAAPQPAATGKLKLAWSSSGRHAHGENGDWYECSCTDELLRPDWGRCVPTCPEHYHLHRPPAGSVYVEPPAPDRIRRENP